MPGSARGSGASHDAKEPQSWRYTFADLTTHIQLQVVVQGRKVASLRVQRPLTDEFLHERSRQRQKCAICS